MKNVSLKKGVPSFIADSTLGRLAKWLRLAGLDTRLDISAPDPMRIERIADTDGRTVLTRAKSVYKQMGPNRCLLIQFDDPMDQGRQVVRHFRIRRQDLQPLSRCALCNLLLSPISKDEVQGRVPEYVWHQYDEFRTCKQCRRIYWPGTHAAHTGSIIDRWFR